MTAERKPRHLDLIGADAALKRAARRALGLALQTGTSCWVLRDGKMVDIAAEARQAAVDAVLLDEVFFSLDAKKYRQFIKLLDTAPVRNPGRARLKAVKAPWKFRTAK